MLTTHSIQLPAFEGPLDLLLRLIEREELDITAVSLAQVTDQYLATIEEMGQRRMADLTAFLVVAARLVLIKSQVLLPGYAASREEATDVAADLVLQLEVYRRFKEVAGELARRDEEGLRTYLRLSTPLPVQAWYDLGDVTLQGLLAAAQEALEALPASAVGEVVSPIAVTVEGQITRIQERLSLGAEVHFSDILSEAVTRVEVIVTLLAVLELLKQDRVQVRQEGLFGPIFIERREPEPGASTAPEPSPA